MVSFSAQCEAFAENALDRLVLVHQYATSYVIEQAQTVRGEGGLMRIDTGYLRASGVGSLSEMPKIQAANTPPPDAGKNSFSYAVNGVELLIAQLGVNNTTFYFGWTASYAYHREVGSRGQPPDAFMRTAVENWQNHVNRAVTEVKRLLS